MFVVCKVVCVSQHSGLTALVFARNKVFQQNKQDQFYAQSVQKVCFDLFVEVCFQFMI